jgi:hypothetical protein
LFCGGSGGGGGGDVGKMMVSWAIEGMRKEDSRKEGWM